MSTSQDEKTSEITFFAWCLALTPVFPRGACGRCGRCGHYASTLPESSCLLQRTSSLSQGDMLNLSLGISLRAALCSEPLWLVSGSRFTPIIPFEITVLEDEPQRCIYIQ